MRTVSLRLADLCDKARVPLGRVGDNLHTQVRIDCLKLFEEYPTATAALTVRPPKGDPYPAVIVRDGDIIVWNVTDSDLIYPGTGEAQLVFTAGDVVAHKAPFKTMVERSIVPTGTVPDPVTNWIEEAEEVLEDVRDAIPEGGTTNQVLAKASNDDYDLKWVDQSGGGGTSDYDQLSNRPQIGGVTLTGNKSLHDLGAAAESDIPDVSGKADKVTNGTENNFAALDANGNLKDSGHKHSDYLTSHQDISGKADKVSSATSGNFAGLDGNGNLTDSGKKASDFLTQHQDISGKSDLTNLAPAFAEGTANDAGTYVTYDGKVYLLPSGHTAGTTWANTTKTETKIGTELSGVKSEISQKQDKGAKVFTDQLEGTEYSNLLFRSYGLTDKRTWMSSVSTNAHPYILSTSDATPAVKGNVFHIDIKNARFEDINSSWLNWDDSVLNIYEMNGDTTLYTKNVAHNTGDAHSWTYEYTVTNESTSTILVQIVVPITNSYALTEGKYIYLTVDRGLIYKGNYTTDLEIEEVVNARGGYGSLDGRLDSIAAAVESLMARKPEGAMERDAYLYRAEIPSQYIATVQSPSSFDNDEYLEKTIREVPNANGFIFVTDTHWESNEKKTVPLLAYVKKRLGINYVLFGGDSIDQQTTGYLAKNIVMDFMYKIKGAFGSKLLPVIGNHETNESNMAKTTKTDTERIEKLLPFSQLQQLYTGDIIGDIHTEYDDVKDDLSDYATGTDLDELEAYFKTIYYVDDTTNMIRYICLNTGNPGASSVVMDGLGIINKLFMIGWTQELRLQYEWFANVLQTVPEGYHVVVVGHQFSEENATPTFESRSQRLAQLAGAALRKASVQIAPWNATVGSAIETWYANGWHTYDFTGVNNIKSIIFICGHCHFDGITVAGLDSNDSFTTWSYTGDTLHQHTKGHVPLILTTTDAYQRYNDAPSGATRTAMTLGTTTDHAFDVVSYVDGGISITRFGAGNNRTIYMD